MDRGHRREVCCVHQVHTGANHICERRSRLAQRLADYLEAAPCLHLRVGIDVAVGPLRGGAGDNNARPHAHRSAVADHELPR